MVSDILSINKREGGWIFNYFYITFRIGTVAAAMVMMQYSLDKQYCVPKILPLILHSFTTSQFLLVVFLLKVSIFRALINLYLFESIDSMLQKERGRT